MTKVDPLVAVIPGDFTSGQRRWLRYFQKVVYDLWQRTGGSADAVSVTQVEKTANYTTTGDFGHEIVVCTNTTAITITLQTLVEKALVTVIRAGTGAVTVDGGSSNIQGQATQNMPRQYDAASMVASSTEWVLN
jgi:hypothetical protein